MLLIFQRKIRSMYSGIRGRRRRRFLPTRVYRGTEHSVDIDGLACATAAYSTVCNSVYSTVYNTEYRSMECLGSWVVPLSPLGDRWGLGIHRTMGGRWDLEIHGATKGPMGPWDPWDLRVRQWGPWDPWDHGGTDGTLGSTAASPSPKSTNVYGAGQDCSCV